MLDLTQTGTTSVRVVRDGQTISNHAQGYKAHVRALVEKITHPLADVTVVVEQTIRVSANPAKLLEALGATIPVEATPEPEPTPVEPDEPEPEPDLPDPEPSPDPPEGWAEAWGTANYDVIRAWYRANTGCRIPDDDLEVIDGNLSSDRAGQVIEGKLVHGTIYIRHDDVTVRDCVVVGSGMGVDVTFANRDNVNAITVEYCSLLGDQPTIDNPDESPGRGIGGTYTIVHAHRVYIWGRGAGLRLGNGHGDRVSECMVEHIVTRPGSHNTGISFRGGSGKRLERNWIEGSTSSALSLYPDAGPITDLTVAENLFDGGGYSVYAGDSKTYRAGNRDLRFVDNVFTRNHTFGPFRNWNPDQPGNRWEGNAYLDGEPVG